MKKKQKSAYSSEEERSAKNEVAAKIQKQRNKISASEKYREKIAGIFRWKEIIDSYKGLNTELENSDIYVGPLNLAFAYIKTEIPALMIRDPKIKVNPKKKSSVKSAKILEKALAYLWRHNRYKRENKKNILDAKLVGHSWFKSGYSANFGLAEEGDTTYEFIKSEEFFGYRVPFDTITFNTDAVDAPYDCTWIAQEFWKPLDFVKDPKNGFQNTEKLNPSSLEDSEKDSTSYTKKDTSGDKARCDYGTPMVKMYEVWDKLANEVYVICDQVDDYLKPPKPWPYQLRGFPFSYLKLNDNPDSAYPMPDVFMFDTQILELQKLRAAMIDHYKRFNRQLLYRQGALTDDALNQLSQGVAGAMIPVQIEDGQPIANVVTGLPYLQIQSDIYAIEERIKEDWINISGQSPQERGATQKTTSRTFRELAQIDRGAKNRRTDQQDLVEDFIEDIAYNQVALLQQLADVKMYVSVTGEDAQSILQSFAEAGVETDGNGFYFTKEDIQGEFDIEVVAGSTAPMDKENKMSLLIQTLELFPQIGVTPGGPVAEAVGRGLAEEWDMPELLSAIDAEAKMKAEQMKKAEEQQQMLAQTQAADRAAELQLDAEKQATDQNKVLLQIFELLASIKRDQQQAQAAKEEKAKAREEGVDAA